MLEKSLNFLVVLLILLKYTQCYFPFPGTKSPLCEFFDSTCFVYAMANATLFNAHCGNDVCLEDCRAVNFKPSVTRTPLDENNFV